MDSAMTVLMGFGGCGILAFLAHFLSGKFANKSKIIEAVHQVVQKQGQKAVKKIEVAQVKVAENIKKGEVVRKESISKIKEIQKKAAVEIQEILKEEKVSVISDTIDDEWDEMTKELG